MAYEVSLQEFVFPSDEICNEREMYFKGNGFSIDKGRIVFKDDGTLTSSTYFNSFSLNKWRQYTGLQKFGITFRLRGDFNVKLCSMKLSKGKAATTVLHEQDISRPEESTLRLEFNLDDRGIVYCELHAKSEGAELYKGTYWALVGNSRALNPVNIAVGICTYKREDYIVPILRRFDSALRNSSSVLFGKIHFFVADNGHTLPLDDLNNEHIHVVYNKNLGGVSGFTRCLLEAKNYGLKFTNFIFLDDDIILDISAMEREVALLSLLLPNYQASVIGGAMLSVDKRYLQIENAAKWEGKGLRFNLRDMDLRDNLSIVLNEEPNDVNYNAWCYCCIPFDIVTDTNLPLPVFFHLDDVEYGLRNNLPVITLNGINVWHKHRGYLLEAANDYYDVRNRLIMLSSINPDSVIPVAYSLLTYYTLEVLRYHYSRAINAFDGILDFSKGFEWFKGLDAQQKNADLYNNVTWQDADDHIRSAAHIPYLERRVRKYKLKAAIKQILPTAKRETVTIDDNSINDASGARSVAVYVPSDNQYIVYKKRRLLAFKCFRKHYEITRKLKKCAPIIKEYHNRLPEVQSINFWDKYLGLQNGEKKKKVLIVASDNDATSGAFRSMSVLSQILKDQYGLDICILIPNSGDGINLVKERGLRYTIIDTVDWIVPKDCSKEAYKKKQEALKTINKNALPKIMRFMEEEKFDLVHLNTSYTYVAAIAAYKLHIPVVWHIREFLEEDQSRKMFDKEYGLSLMRKADRVVAISKAVYAKYSNLLHTDNLVQIYNGISTEEFLCSERTILNNDKITFIAVGNINPYKGQRLIVDALHKLKENGFNDFELLLVGNDRSQYCGEIRSAIVEYNMSEQVKILGKRQDVNELFRLADISFVGSKFEAFGRITVESMLSGCLVIGANTAGTQELICDDSDGLLFESDDVESLYERLRYALDNRERMKDLAANGRNKALNEFSAAKNAKEIHDLYTRIWEKA
ncbi:MAG: glycosyltransferase [Clostridia bacterium]|nr:glycosyltransferase [Clostridia bacterium]